MKLSSVLLMTLVVSSGSALADDIHCRVNNLGDEVCENRTTGDRTVTHVDSLGQEVTKEDGRTIQTCKVNNLGEKQCR